MEPVIRMFTSDSGTVRWITRIAGTEGLAFSVAGPDNWRNCSLFADPLALVRFQSEYEQFLRASGYTVSPVEERRSQGERRAYPRGDDRRRPS